MPRLCQALHQRGTFRTISPVVKSGHALFTIWCVATVSYPSRVTIGKLSTMTKTKPIGHQAEVTTFMPGVQLPTSWGVERWFGVEPKGYPVKHRKFRVLICGDRHDERGTLVFRYMKKIREHYGCENVTVLTGGATGVDRNAAFFAPVLGFNLVVRVAKWTKYGRRAGPIRNRVLLDLKPDMVIAFHRNLDKSKGTRDCVTEAKKRGIKVKVVTE